MYRAVILFTLMVLLSGLVPRAGAEEKLDLRLRPRKGDVHRVSVALEQTIDQTIQGLKQQTSQTIGLGYTFSVQDVDDQGTATIAVKYESVEFHAKTPAGPVDYDSASPPPQVPPMASGFAGLLGQGYSMKINAGGQVVQITGLDKLLAGVLAKLNVPEGPARAAAERTLRQQLNEPNLRANLQSVFAPYPDHLVAIGDSWGRKTEVSLGFPLLVETSYTLKSRDAGIATIDLRGTARSAPDAAVDFGQIKMNYALSGEQNGTIRIDEATGWTRGADLFQKLTGSATLRAPNAPAQMVPMSIESKMKMESK